MNQKYFIKILTGVIITVVVIGTASYFFVSQKQLEPTQKLENIDDIKPAPGTNSAPVEDYLTPRGYNYEIFTDQIQLYTYRHPEGIFEFSYPQQWGSVSVDPTGKTFSVGPFVMFLGEKGEFAEGDEIAIFGMYGYYKKDGRFYSNWFKDSENGPYAFTEADWDDLVEIPAANGMALLHASKCYDMGCGRVVSINLNDDIYTGVGIRSDRGDNNHDPDPKSDTNVLAESYDAVLDELRIFLKTFKVL